MLDFLIACSKSLGYKSIIVLFDKIDEFQKLSGDLDRITKFALEILTDTELLLSDKIAIVFSLWSEIQRSLNVQGVRFDKFRPVDIRWSKEDLIPLINKRLLYFSDNKIVPVTFESLIKDPRDQALVLKLADCSPRSLIMLLSTIYNEPGCSKDQIAFNKTAISNGTLRFCRTFDFESLRPSKLGRRNDYYNWINRILRIRKTTFSISDINGVFRQKSPTSQKHIEEMVKLGLIKENFVRDENEEIQYDVVDFRIQHLISRGITSIDI